MGWFTSKKKEQEKVAESIIEEVQDLSKHKSKREMHESIEFQKHITANYGCQNYAVKNFWEKIKILEGQTKNLDVKDIAYGIGNHQEFYQYKQQIENHQFLIEMQPMINSCKSILDDIEDIRHLLKKFVPHKEIKIYKELKKGEKNILERAKKISSLVFTIQSLIKSISNEEGNKDEAETKQLLTEYKEKLTEAVTMTEELAKDLSDANFGLRRISDDNTIFYKAVEEHISKLDAMGTWNGKDKDLDKERSFSKDPHIIGTEASSGLGKYTVKKSVRKYLKDNYNEDMDDIIKEKYKKTG